MNHKHDRRLTFLVLLAASLASAPLASSQDTADSARQPTANEIVQRSAKAVGGKAAYRKIQSLTMRGTFRLDAAKDLNGKVVMHYLAPDRARITVDIEKLGTTDKGVNPKMAWERSPTKGERKLGQNESRRLIESISLRAAFEPEQVYASMVNRGVVTILGEPCHHLQMVRPNAEGNDEVYFSVATGLPIRTITSRPMTAGGGTVQSDVSDYKDFDGIKIATKIVQKEESNLTYEINIQSVRINQGTDEAVFDEPVSMKGGQ